MVYVYIAVFNANDDGWVRNPGARAGRPAHLRKAGQTGNAPDTYTRLQKTKPTPHKPRRSSPGARAQHPTVRARPLEDSVPRAGDLCTDRSPTRRHFSGAGRVQREGARGRLCAAFLLRHASLLCWFGHSPILGGNLPSGVQKTLGSSLKQRPGGRGYMNMSL